MAEIVGVGVGVSDPSIRPSKPGKKRLLLTLTVFTSFLLSLPFLLHSTNIHRSPLPDASNSATPTHLLHFHAIFIHHTPTIAISSLIAPHLPPNLNFTLAVTVQPNSPYPPSLFHHPDDHHIDDTLAAITAAQGVYTVVIAEGDERRAVVGKYRHGWVVAKAAEEGIEMAARVFVEMAGGGDAVVGKEFMPVGADGDLVLSFTLLNADPTHWVYDWDYEEIDAMLSHVVDDLRPVANIHIESQVLYHTPKSSVSYWDEELEANIFSQSDLPFFVNSNEWHLDTSIAAGGRSKVLQFAVYIPSATEYPLLLRLPNGDISKSNGFVSPLWGGVVVWNPPNCSETSQRSVPLRHTIPHQDHHTILQVFIGQLRSLFGFKPEYFDPVEVGMPKFLFSESGFTKWELDVLYRRYASYNLISSAATLESLSHLVQSLPRMIVMDEIGKQVKLSLDAASLAQRNAYDGISDSSAVWSKDARALAEDAFFHPSLMSISYSSNEHYFAIYMPFFVPVLLHVLLAAIKELKRFKKERSKYLAFIADQAQTS